MHEHSKIFLRGFDAYNRGLSLEECPHWFDQFKQLWKDGWLHSERVHFGRIQIHGERG